MFIKKIDEEEKNLCVAIPLTTASGKVRIKQRNVFSEYGLHISPRRTPFAQNQYVEWQIGYDVVVDEWEKLRLTKLPEKRFIGANGKEKALYELSEYLFFLHRWQIVSEAALQDIRRFLENLSPESLFDVHHDLVINRSHFIEKELNETNFLFARIEYPILVYKFEQYEILAEIVTREKQRAIGVQPMLYLCFPVTELIANPPLIGRTANQSEIAYFTVSKKNADVFLQVLKLFGMLSKNHRKDVLSIIDIILKQ